LEKPAGWLETEALVEAERLALRILVAWVEQVAWVVLVVLYILAGFLDKALEQLKIHILILELLPLLLQLVVKAVLAAPEVLMGGRGDMVLEAQEILAAPVAQFLPED